MSAPAVGAELIEELRKLEESCQQAAREIASAKTIREVVNLANVDVPHHLKSFARNSVPTLGRLGRTRDMRVEEIVKDQIDMIRRERTESIASREFDRIKANDWHVLRSNYSELYTKSLHEVNMILERKRKEK